MIDEGQLDIKKAFDSERITANERDKTLEQLEKQNTIMKHIYKRYNPLTIKPAFTREMTIIRLYREMHLFDDIKGNNIILKPTKGKRLFKKLLMGYN